ARPGPATRHASEEPNSATNTRHASEEPNSATNTRHASEEPSGVTSIRHASEKNKAPSRKSSVLRSNPNYAANLPADRVTKPSYSRSPPKIPNSINRLAKILYRSR